jgi:hypothetical protein
MCNRGASTSPACGPAPVTIVPRITTSAERDTCRREKTLGCKGEILLTAGLWRRVYKDVAAAIKIVDNR